MVFRLAESHRGRDETGYAKGLGEMFDDFNEAKDRYDRGEFVHANSALIGDYLHYGESFIPEAYVRSAYTNHLSFVDFLERDGDHPIVFLKKPQATVSPAGR